MEDNTEIDDLFKDKINQIIDLPDGIGWNPVKGWSEYTRQFSAVKVPGKRIIICMTSAAASIFILAILFLNNSDDTKTILEFNQENGIKEISLPDGNSVWLNKNSSVEYPSDINKNKAEILIKGEAYIEIANLRSRQYIIEAHNAVVIAEAFTSFNIKAYQEEENINISVASGAVKIAVKDFRQGLTLLLTEGNYCSVHRSQKLVYAAINKNDNYLTWKTGKLVFNNQPIATVKEILDMYYETKIELENDAIAYCLFSGTFERKPIEVILNKIQSDLNLKILNTGTEIIFSGKGCL